MEEMKKKKKKARVFKAEFWWQIISHGNERSMTAEKSLLVCESIMLSSQIREREWSGYSRS